MRNQDHDASELQGACTHTEIHCVSLKHRLLSDRKGSGYIQNGSTRRTVTGSRPVLCLDISDTYSLYAVSSVPRFLGVHIPFDGIAAHIALCRDKEAPGPQRRHLCKLREFLAERKRSRAFELVHDIRRAQRRKTAQKQIRMIDMAFHGEDFDTKALALSCRQCFETLRHAGDVEDLPPVAGAEYKVIVDQRHCGFCFSIIIIHMYIISYKYTY